MKYIKYSCFTFKNFFNSIIVYYIARFSSTLLIIIILPYTSRELDHNNFSLLMYTLSFGVWVSMLVSYGNGMSGIRNLATSYRNTNAISTIISETLTLQAHLSLFCCFTVALLHELKILHHEFSFLLLGLIYGIVQGYNPLWIFQSIQKVRSIAYLELFINSITLCIIFIITTHYENYIAIILIVISSKILTNTISYCIIIYKYKVPIFFASLKNSLARMKTNFSLFFLVSSVSLYTTLASIILGHFAGILAVGVFSAMEKLVRGFTSIILPISQAIIPHRYFLSGQKNKIDFLNKYTIYLATSFAILASMILFFFTKYWAFLYLGSSYINASSILKILAWVIPCYVASTILSTQYLIPANKERICNIIYFSAGVSSILLTTLFTTKYGAIGMAYIMVFVELNVLIFMVIATKLCLSQAKSIPSRCHATHLKRQKSTIVDTQQRKVYHSPTPRQTNQ